MKRERERERRGVDGWREWSARKESCFFTAEVTEKDLEPEQKGIYNVESGYRARGNTTNYLYRMILLTLILLQSRAR